MPEPRPSLALAALRGRCPRCGEGALFQGFLSLRPACPICGEDFAKADTGDGPAVFVMFLVGALTVPVAFLLGLGLGLGPILTIALTSLLAIALCAAVLRPFKAALFVLQWRHDAGEARFDP